MDSISHVHLLKENKSHFFSIGKVLYKGLPHVLANSSLPVKSHPHFIDKQIDSVDLRDSPKLALLVPHAAHGLFL